MTHVFRIAILVLALFTFSFAKAETCELPLGVSPEVYVQEWWYHDESNASLRYFVQNQSDETKSVSLNLVVFKRFKVTCLPVFEVITEIFPSLELAPKQVFSVNSDVVLPEFCETQLCLVSVTDAVTKAPLGYLHAPRSRAHTQLQTPTFATCAGANIGAMGCEFGVVVPELDDSQKFTGRVKVKLRLQPNWTYEVFKQGQFADSFTVLKLHGLGLDVTENEKSFLVSTSEVAGGIGSGELEMQVDVASQSAMKHFEVRFSELDSQGNIVGTLNSFFLIPPAF